MKKKSPFGKKEDYDQNAAWNDVIPKLAVNAAFASTCICGANISSHSQCKSPPISPPPLEKHTT
jgi:hypothetical protein